MRHLLRLYHRTPTWVFLFAIAAMLFGSYAAEQIDWTRTCSQRAAFYHMRGECPHTIWSNF